MEEMEVISIIIPIYNVEDYLPHCLDSIVAQTYPKLEVILVNDGSPDHCEEICQQYIERYPHFKYYYKENGGLSDARNYGIERATGKYIGFVDSDDYILPDMYQILYKDLVGKDADIATVGYEMVCAHGTKKQDQEYSLEVFSQEEAIKHLFSNKKIENYVWNKLFKASLFENIRFPDGKIMEDLGTTYKLFLRANRITYNSSKQYMYFQRAESILHNIKKGYFEDKLTLSQERYLFLTSQYPDMEENRLFYLNTALECLPYLEKNSDLFQETLMILSTMINKPILRLSTKRKIKYFFLSISPTLFISIFRKKYEN